MISVQNQRDVIVSSYPEGRCEIETIRSTIMIVNSTKIAYHPVTKKNLLAKNSEISSMPSIFAREFKSRRRDN